MQYDIKSIYTIDFVGLDFKHVLACWEYIRVGITGIRGDWPKWGGPITNTGPVPLVFKQIEREK